MALRGLLVVDLSRVLAGPWCTQTLADLGARVIKVERRGGGDDTRGWGPPFAETRAGAPPSAYYLTANRNKKGIALDLGKGSGGTDVVRRLIERADVVVENFKAGTMDKWGLGYDELRKTNPDLVYCSITGYGEGARLSKPGYDFLAQAEGGLMAVTGGGDGEDGGGDDRPVKLGVALVDLMAGMYASSGILAAVLHARGGGGGQRVDINLLDVSTAMLANQGLSFLAGGGEPVRRASSHPSIFPYSLFATRERQIVIAVGNDSQWRKCCDVLWAGDEAAAFVANYRTNAERVRKRSELRAAMEAVLETRDADEWIRLLEAAGVPCSVFNDKLHDVFHRPVDGRKTHVKLPHSLAKDADGFPSLLFPAHLSATGIPASQWTAPPFLGEHTDEVLADFFTPDELDELRRGGIIDNSSISNDQ